MARHLSRFVIAILVLTVSFSHARGADSHLVTSTISSLESTSSGLKNIENTNLSIDSKIENPELQEESHNTSSAFTEKDSKNTYKQVIVILAIVLLLCLTLRLYRSINLRNRENKLLQSKNTELRIAKENAEKATAAKAQFLSNITHELRTPIYAVTGITHLLLKENPTEEQKKHLNSIKFSGEHLLSLINNILDLNKLEADKVEVEKKAFNLKKRIQDVLFALEKSANDKGNKVHFQFGENIPKDILGDSLIISQVLINLVGNAIKFTQNGDIYLRVQKVNESKKSINLHFEIEDNGEGISKDKQNSIFESFTQGSVAINRKFGGTGLGLSIVKNLLDLLNSEITLESTLGKGSKFSFDLEFDNILLSDKEKSDYNKTYDVDYAALENHTFLVVEDNKINQMITRKILEKNKISCDVADSGEMALEKARSEEYDLILMDIHMPGIGGLEATKRIREFNNTIPILALTAVALEENAERLKKSGINDIIPKPYKIDEFFYKIQQALKKAKG